MINKLDNFENWQKIAKDVGWTVENLAKECGVSIRTLEMHFQQTFGTTPKAWLTEQRQKQAICLLQDGLRVKEVAAQLDYKYTPHFSRDFKKHWGYCPKQINAGPIVNRVRALV
jgi:AraC-like DNA-binding protein